MSNRKKDALDGIAEAALDTEAAHIEAEMNLELIDKVDEAMDREQDRAYEMLRDVEEHSHDPQARAIVHQALEKLGVAEELEDVIEDSVHQGQESVQEARESNQEVIAVTEQWRSPAGRKGTDA